MYTSENNWYYWQYNSGPRFGRKQVGDKFTTTFSPYSGPVGSFKQELLNAASSTLDHFSGLKPSIFLSGGLDSEIMLRAFLEVGANPDVYIFRYENDYNIYDVSYAVTICSMLGIDYKIVDFNLEKFYENDAERISELSQIDRPRAMPYCKFMEIVDGVPIIGASDLYIDRTDNDYTKKGSWVVRCWEHDVGWSKFVREINKPAVAEWFKWTPGLILSFINLDWCKKLVNDEYYGKLGTNSTKIIGYREGAYSDLIFRKKQTGFERIDHLVNTFEEFLKKKNREFRFRDSYFRPFEQFEKEIRGT